MYIVLIICGLYVVLIATAVLLRRRRRRRLTAMVEARGGKVVKIGFSPTPHALRDFVDYVGPQGELRRAFRWQRASDLSDDQPFQHVLREKYENSRSDSLLRAVELAAAQSRLPGFDEYQALARELAAGSIESVTVEESPSDSAPKWRFAPVVQCLEAANIASDRRSEQVLDLVVGGKNVELHWSVQGIAPHRVLVVARVPRRG